DKTYSCRIKSRIQGITHTQPVHYLCLQILLSMIKTLIATVKNRIGIFLTALLCCLLTSCFDLLEQIDINSQGSGTIKATLNLSKSSTKVASLMKLKEFNGIAIPSETDIRREMAQIVSKLKTTQGISDVQYELD